MTATATGLSPVFAAIVGVYLLVLLVIGWWAGRGSTGVAAYYVADKKLPSWVIAFSSNTTGESAWLLLGLTGMGYTLGVHAFWIVLGEVLGVALGWALVAPRFKAWTDRFDSITVPDYLEARFGDPRRAFRWLSLLIVGTMVVAYTAAQVTASGKAFASFVGTSYTTGAIVGTVVILYYTTVGGFRAVAYSDLLQGVLMFFGLLALPIVGIAAAGGWGPVLETLDATDPALLQPMGSYGWTLEGVISAVGFVGIGLAFLGAPQLLTRFISARSQLDIRAGGLIAVICIVVFDIGAVLGGMAGRALFPGLADPETILPTMTGALLPTAFAAVYFVIVLAAIMSTVDSLLILASATLVRDVVQRVLAPDMTDRRLALLGRLTTVVVGVLGLAFALAEVRVVFWFVLFAWSGLACAFAPPVLCSLFWKRTTRAGAIAGMVAGFTTAIVWVAVLKPYTYDLYEMVPGFVVGLAVTIAVSLRSEPPPDVDREFTAVRALIDHRD